MATSSPRPDGRRREEAGGTGAPSPDEPSSHATSRDASRPDATSRDATSPEATSSDATGPDASPSEEVDFGPSGYLPHRAAKRARKIVLRAPMGLQWPVAAGIAAVVVLVLGVLYLLTRTGPPAAPFVPAGPLDAIDPRGSAVVEAGGSDVLVVRGGGGVSAFAAPTADAAWCPGSRRIESADARVWTVDGRLVGGGGASLQPLDVAVYDGDLYVDPTSDRPAPPAAPRGEEPVCIGGGMT